MSEPRKVPRFLSCLVKGPLGCLAFFAGAGIVLILFLPWAGGRIADHECEQWFVTHFEGGLDLGDVWLGSFYGPQRIESVILRDPEGDEVLRARLNGPTLSGIFDGPVHRYGPVSVRVPVLRVVPGRGGTTNLERALTPREDAFAALPSRARGLRSGLDTDVPFQVGIQLVIDHLRYVDPGGGAERTLENLSFVGSLDWGPDETHLVLEGGNDESPEDEPVHARLELERLELSPPGPWKISLILNNVPTGLARAACAALRPLAPFLGPRTDELALERDNGELLVHLADEGASFTLDGTEEGGQVVAREGSAAELSLPCDDARARALLELLVPLARAGECADETQAHVLTLRRFAWPLGNGWSELAGELALALAPLRFTGSPALETLLHGRRLEPLPLVPVPEPLRARLQVQDGVVRYAQFRLPFAHGWLALDGTLDLAHATYDITVAAEDSGEALDLGHLQGARDALAPVAPTVPTPPTDPPLQGDVPLPPKSGG